MMKSEEVLPKISRHRFSLTVRIIASILVVTFLAQDIVWAHPDSFVKPASNNDKLAPRSMFQNTPQESINKYYVTCIREKIKEVCQKTGVPLHKLSLESACAIIDKFNDIDELEITESQAGEILVTFAGGNMLRLYDPTKVDSEKYSNKIIEQLPMPEGSIFNIQYIRTELIEGPKKEILKKDKIVPESIKEINQCLKLLKNMLDRHERKERINEEDVSKAIEAIDIIKSNAQLIAMDRSKIIKNRPYVIRGAGYDVITTLLDLIELFCEDREADNATGKLLDEAVIAITSIVDYNSKGINYLGLWTNFTIPFLRKVVKDTRFSLEARSAAAGTVNAYLQRMKRCGTQFLLSSLFLVVGASLFFMFTQSGFEKLSPLFFFIAPFMTIYVYNSEHSQAGLSVDDNGRGGLLSLGRATGVLGVITMILKGFLPSFFVLFDELRERKKDYQPDVPNIRDANELSKYIDKLRLEEAERTGKQESLAAILADREKYEKCFFAPLRKLLLQRLRSDFEFPVNCDEADLLTTLRTMKKRNAAGRVSIKFYGLILHCLYKDSRPYILALYDASMQGRSCEEITMAKRQYPHHTMVDSGVHSYGKKSAVFEGEQSYYRIAEKELQKLRGVRIRYEENKIDSALISENHDKVIEAKKWWRVGYKAPANKPGEKDRIEKFDNGSTVVEIGEMNTFLIYSDPENGIVCPIHIGRHSRTIYRSKKYFDELDINNKDDMAELAFWLNVGQTFIDIRDNGNEFGMDFQDINEELLRFTSNCLNQRSDIADTQKIKNKLAYFMREDTATCYTTIMDRLITDSSVIDLCIKSSEELAKIKKERTKKEMMDYLWSMDGDRRQRLVDFYGEYRNDCRHLLYRYESLGLHEWAERAYEAMKAATRIVQFYDQGGYKPGEFQVDLIFVALRLGKLDDAFEELETLLTGKGYLLRNMKRTELLDLREFTISSPSRITSEGEKVSVYHSFESEFDSALQAQLELLPASERLFYTEMSDRILNRYFEKKVEDRFGDLELKYIDEDRECVYEDAVVDKNGYIKSNPKYKLPASYAGREVRLIAVDDKWDKGFKVICGLNEVAYYVPGIEGMITMSEVAPGTINSESNSGDGSDIVSGLRIWPKHHGMGGPAGWLGMIWRIFSFGIFSFVVQPAGKSEIAISVPKNRVKKWTKERIIGLLQNPPSDVPKPLSSTSWKKNFNDPTLGLNGGRMVEKAKRLFGSWTNAVIAAGLKPIDRNVGTKEEILELLKNPPPTVKDPVRQFEWNRAGYKREVDKAKYVFGSWKAALMAAGLEDTRPKKLSREEILELLRNPPVEISNPLIYDEWVKTKYRKIAHRAVKEFGGWKKVIEESGILSLKRHHWVGKYTDWNVVKSIIPDLVDLHADGSASIVAYSRYPDEAECSALAAEIQRGNFAARDALVLTNEKISREIAERFMPESSFDYDDLVSVGVLGWSQSGRDGLFFAAETFNPAENAKFGTYAYIYVRAAIYHYVRSMKRIKAVSIEQPAIDHDAKTRLALKIVDNNIDTQKSAETHLAVSEIIAHLDKNMQVSENNKDIFKERFIDGKSFEDIANKHGITYSAINQTINKLIVRIADSMRPAAFGFMPFSKHRGYGGGPIGFMRAGLRLLFHGMLLFIFQPKAAKVEGSENNPNFSGLIAGIGLSQDATDRDVDAALLEITDDAGANAKLLKILGFNKKQIPLLVGAMATKKPDLFGNRLNTTADLDNVPDIGTGTIAAARKKIRLGARCYSKYKEAFANFITLAYTINRKDNEDEISKKIDDKFAEHKELLTDEEFLKSMAEYFEHEPDILLSLAYIIWSEIRAGPVNSVRENLINILRDLADGRNGAPLSYYRLAAMRYIAPLDAMKNTHAVFNRLCLEFPEPGEHYNAIYKTLVELARHEDLSVFYAFAQSNKKRPELALIAIKAVAEARRGTNDLKKFLEVAKRNPNTEVQDYVRAVELSQPIFPDVKFPNIKGVPDPELLETVSAKRKHFLKRLTALPTGMVSTGIMPNGSGKKLNYNGRSYSEEGYVFGYLACLEARRMWGRVAASEAIGRDIFYSVYETVSDFHEHGGLGATINIRMSANSDLEVVCDSVDPSHRMDQEKVEGFSKKMPSICEYIIESDHKKWERHADGAVTYVGESNKGSGVMVTMKWHKPQDRAITNYEKLNAVNQKNIDSVNKKNDPFVAETLAAFLLGLLNRNDTTTSIADHLAREYPDYGEGGTAEINARKMVDWLGRLTENTTIAPDVITSDPAGKDVEVIVLNGKTVTRQECEREVAEITKGFFRFNVRLEDSKLLLGWTNDPTENHSDIKSPKTSMGTFAGFLTSDRTIFLLPEFVYSIPFQGDGKVEEYHDKCIMIARELIKLGFPQSLHLSWLAKESLENELLFAVAKPQTLKSLADQPLMNFTGPSVVVQALDNIKPRQTKVDIVERKITVGTKKGLHTTPSLIISDLAKRVSDEFHVNISISKVRSDDVIMASMTLGVLSLGAECNDELIFSANGPYSCEKLNKVLDAFQDILGTKEWPSEVTSEEQKHKEVVRRYLNDIRKILGIWVMEDVYAKRQVEAIEKSPKPFIPNLPWRTLGIIGIIVTSTALTLYTGSPIYSLAVVGAAVQLSKKDKHPIKGRAIGALYSDESAKERVTGNVIVKDKDGFLAFYNPKDRKILYMQDGKEAALRFYPSGINPNVYKLEKNDFIQGFIGSDISYITADALSEELEYFYKKQDDHYAQNPEDAERLKALYGVNDIGGVIDRDIRFNYVKLVRRALLFAEICSFLFKYTNNRPAANWPELFLWMRSDSRVGQRFPDESELAAMDSLRKCVHLYGEFDAIRKRLKFPDTSLQLNDDLHKELLVLFKKCHAIHPDDSYIYVWAELDGLSVKSKTAMKEYVAAIWDSSTAPSEEDIIKIVKEGFLSRIVATNPEVMFSIAEQLDRNRHFDDLNILYKTYKDMGIKIPDRVARITETISIKTLQAKLNKAKYGLELKEGSYCLTDDEVDKHLMEEYLIGDDVGNDSGPLSHQARNMIRALRYFTNKPQHNDETDSENEGEEKSEKRNFNCHVQASNVLNRLEEIDRNRLIKTLLRLEESAPEDLGKIMWAFWRTDLGRHLIRRMEPDQPKPFYANGENTLKYTARGFTRYRKSENKPPDLTNRARNHHPEPAKSIFSTPEDAIDASNAAPATYEETRARMAAGTPVATTQNIASMPHDGADLSSLYAKRQEMAAAISSVLTQSYSIKQEFPEREYTQIFDELEEALFGYLKLKDMTSDTCIDCSKKLRLIINHVQGRWIRMHSKIKESEKGVAFEKLRNSLVNLYQVNRHISERMVLLEKEIEKNQTRIQSLLSNFTDNMPKELANNVYWCSAADDVYKFIGNNYKTITWNEDFSCLINQCIRLRMEAARYSRKLSVPQKRKSLKRFVNYAGKFLDSIYEAMDKELLLQGLRKTEHTVIANAKIPDLFNLPIVLKFKGINDGTDFSYGVLSLEYSLGASSKTSQLFRREGLFNLKGFSRAFSEFVYMFEMARYPDERPNGLTVADWKRLKDLPYRDRMKGIIPIAVNKCLAGQVKWAAGSLASETGGSGEASRDEQAANTRRNAYLQDRGSIGRSAKWNTPPEPDKKSTGATKIASLCNKLKTEADNMDVKQVYAAFHSSGVTKVITPSNKERSATIEAYGRIKGAYDKTNAFPFKTSAGIIHYHLSNIHWTSLSRIANLSEDEFIRYTEKMLMASSLYEKIEKIDHSLQPCNAAEYINMPAEADLDSAIQKMESVVHRQGPTLPKPFTNGLELFGFDSTAKGESEYSEVTKEKLVRAQAVLKDILVIPPSYAGRLLVTQYIVDEWLRSGKLPSKDAIAKKTHMTYYAILGRFQYAMKFIKDPESAKNEILNHNKTPDKTRASASFLNKMREEMQKALQKKESRKSLSAEPSDILRAPSSEEIKSIENEAMGAFIKDVKCMQAAMHSANYDNFTYRYKAKYPTICRYIKFYRDKLCTKEEYPQSGIEMLLRRVIYSMPLNDFTRDTMAAFDECLPLWNKCKELAKTNDGIADKLNIIKKRLKVSMFFIDDLRLIREVTVLCRDILKQSEAPSIIAKNNIKRWNRRPKDRRGMISLSGSSDDENNVVGKKPIEAESPAAAETSTTDTDNGMALSGMVPDPAYIVASENAQIILRQMTSDGMSWKVVNNGKTLAFSIADASVKLPEKNLLRDMWPYYSSWMNNEEWQKDNAILKSSEEMEQEINESRFEESELREGKEDTTVFLYDEEANAIAGLYVVQNRSAYVEAFFVRNDYKGTGAIDIMIKDFERRYRQRYPESKETRFSTQIRRIDAKSGKHTEFDGTTDEFRALLRGMDYVPIIEPFAVIPVAQESASEALRSPTGVDELRDKAVPAAAGGYRKSLWTTPEDALLLTPLNYVFIEEVGASIKDPNLQQKLDDAKRLNDRINPEGHWWGVAGKASDMITKTKEFFRSLPIENADKEFGIIEECLQNLDDHGGVFGALLMYFKPRAAGKAECVFIVLDQGKAFLDRNKNPLPIAKAVEPGVTTKGYPDNMGIGLHLVNGATKRLDIIGISSSGEGRDGAYYQKSEDGQVHTGCLSDNDLNNIGIPHGARLIGSFEVKMQTSHPSIPDTQRSFAAEAEQDVARLSPNEMTLKDSKIRPSEKRWNRRPKDRRGMISFGKPSDDENNVVGKKPIEQENKSLPDAELKEAEEQIVICKSVEFMKPAIASLERLIAGIDPNSPNPAVLYVLKDRLDEVRKYPLHYIFPACSDRYSWIGHAIGNGAISMLNDFSIRDDGSKVDMEALLLSLERMRVFINSLSEVIAAKELGSIDKYKRNDYILDITALNRNSVTAAPVEAPAAAAESPSAAETSTTDTDNVISLSKTAPELPEQKAVLDGKITSPMIAGRKAIEKALADRGVEFVSDWQGDENIPLKKWINTLLRQRFNKPRNSFIWNDGGDESNERGPAISLKAKIGTGHIALICGSEMQIFKIDSEGRRMVCMTIRIPFDPETDSLGIYKIGDLLRVLTMRYFRGDSFPSLSLYAFDVAGEVESKLEKIDIYGDGSWLQGIEPNSLKVDDNRHTFKFTTKDGMECECFMINGAPVAAEEDVPSRELSSSDLKFLDAIIKKHSRLHSDDIIVRDILKEFMRTSANLREGSPLFIYRKAEAAGRLAAYLKEHYMYMHAPSEARDLMNDLTSSHAMELRPVYVQWATRYTEKIWKAMADMAKSGDAIGQMEGSFEDLERRRNNREYGAWLNIEDNAAKDENLPEVFTVAAGDLKPRQDNTVVFRAVDDRGDPKHIYGFIEIRYNQNPEDPIEITSLMVSRQFENLHPEIELLDRVASYQHRKMFMYVDTQNEELINILDHYGFAKTRILKDYFGQNKDAQLMEYHIKAASEEGFLQMPPTAEPTTSEKMGQSLTREMVSAEIAEGSRLLKEALAEAKLPNDAQVLLSESLFEELDARTLKSQLGEGKIAKVVSFDRIKAVATDKEADKEKSERKIACVMTRSEFEKLCKQRGLTQNKNSLKATIIVIDDLKGRNYLRLGGVVAWAVAMMSRNVDKTKMCIKFLFGDIEIDDARLMDSFELALYLIHSMLGFRPTTQNDIDDNIEHYKRMAQDALIMV